MQTFLTGFDFRLSAYHIDNKRLNKQITEGRQIFDILINNKNSRWSKHPAVLMWKGYEKALLFYIVACYSEWCFRLIKEKRMGTLTHLSYEWVIDNSYDIIKSKYIFPPWINDKRVYASHRAALLAKDYDYYKQFNWSEKPKIDYFWPTEHGYQIADNNKLYVWGK